MGRRRRDIVIAVSAVLTAVALVVAGTLVFSRGHHAGTPAVSSPATVTSPLTGEKVSRLGPVLAVKIDNIVQARPQTGLTAADIVYVLLAEAHGASTAHDIGFRFGPAPSGGSPATSRSAKYSAASFTFTWSAAASRWLVRMDGSPARSTDDGQLSAATVVIQYTTVRTSRFLEYGQRPPYADSTGSGTGVVLRDGGAWDIRWSRPAADGGTSFTTAAGLPMTFARGPVWVVLAPRP